MKKLFIVANWKSYKTAQEATDWLSEMKKLSFPEDKEVIVCASFTSLPAMKTFIDTNNVSIKLGTEDVSPFGEGAYTGEISAEQAAEFVTHAIVGHSERRNNFAETDQVVAEKVEMAFKFNITPIFCVQGKDTPIPKGIEIVAYEPVFAIGTGHPDTPDDAEDVAKYIKANHEVKYVLYGGSVTADDVHGFTQMPSVDGVLVGGASLDPHKFTQIIQNA